MNRREFLLASSATAYLVSPSARASEGVAADKIVFGQAAVFDGPASALGLGMRDGIRAAFSGSRASSNSHPPS